MPATDLDWRRAFARQGLSDLDARELLVKGPDRCHELHFLQMAAEKICKAYRLDLPRGRGFKPRHDVIAETLPQLARHFSDSGLRRKSSKGLAGAVGQLAKEIELLSPMCKDDGAREDNSEYPWKNSQGDVVAPCLYNFPELDGGGRTLFQVIKLLRVAGEKYVR